LNVVDSSGWLEYFAQGPNLDFFRDPIERLDDLLVPSICLLEVFRRTYQQSGRSAAYRALAQMRQGQIVDLDRKIAVASAKLGLTQKLALADSVVLATTRAFDAVLWTQDADFREIAGVKFRPKT
jgi:predicted nucleic acid-binding protein